MHIQEGTNTTLTTCTKMTEEVDRRHGVNGNSSGKSGTEDAPVHSSAHTGGRLKFFKDGKFILELVRGSAREGERAGWVSVPRKTFWPPAGAPPTPPAPPAPPAALSVSDDNSSVQSSPWQRDHCWKQAAPRRGLSRHLAMYYCRPSTLTAAAIEAGARAKRRRPHDTGHADARRPLAPANGVCDTKRNGDVDGWRDDVDDGATAAGDRDTYYHVKLKKPYQYHKLRVYRKTRPGRSRRGELAKIVDKLRERVAALPAPVNAKLASCRQEHMMVSPRKRILRELERVSLEEQGSKRRAKTVPALSTASYPPAASPGAGAGPSHAPRHNGAPPPRKEPPVSKNVSSYSIHSLLSMPEEAADAKRSPHSYPASLKTESPCSARSPDLSPSPDGYRYRYSALALGSPGPGVAPRDSPTPPSDMQRYRTSGAGAYAQPPSPYAACPRQWAAGTGTGALRQSPARDEWRDAPYVYGYGYGYVGAPYRPPLGAPSAAPAPAPAPAPLWLHYLPPAAPGAPGAPGPWAPLAHPLLTDHIPKDEPTSDLPLNLSKH